MSVITFDYGMLNSAIHEASKMKGGWGSYESYRSELNSKLYSSLDEWKLAGKEPKGHAYVSCARDEITGKRAELSSRANEWGNLATNLGNFKTYVENQDKAVEKEFVVMTKQYTNYSGIGGFFTWLGDTYYNVYAVDFANSNAFTRKIAEIKKVVDDDFDTWKQGAIDWFKHGDGRYVANIIGSVALTTAAIAGTVVAFLGIPFTGGTSAVIAVGLIGAIAGSVGAAISAFNTYHTIKENNQALSIADDPARARFHGDVSSYSEHVSKHVYDSPEEYQKHTKIGKRIDVIEGICTVVSAGASAATTFGTKTVLTSVENGNKVSQTTFDLSNIKNNVLNTFGFKVTKDVSSIDIVGYEKSLNINTANKLENSTIDVVNSSEKIKMTEKTLEKSAQEIGKTKYTKSVISINKFSGTSEYTSVVASNGIVTGSYTEYAVQAQKSAKTIDYTNAIMSKDTVSKISDLKKIQDAVTPGQITKQKWSHGLKQVQNIGQTGGKITKDLTRLKDKTVTEIVKDIATKNNFINAVDKYVYSIPTGENANVNDYLKGIGGSNAGKVWNLWKMVSDKVA